MLEQILADTNLIQTVGLTGEQVKTLRSVISISKNEQTKLKSEMDTAAAEQADVWRAVTQTNVDEKALMKTVEKVCSLRTQIMRSQIKQLILVNKTLAPEQYKKAKEIYKETPKEPMDVPGQRTDGHNEKEKPVALWGGLTYVESLGFRGGMLLEKTLADPDKVQKVGMSDEQVKTLRSSISSTKQEQINFQSELNALAVDQAGKMVKSDVDEKEIMKTVEKAGDLRTQLVKTWIKQLILAKRTLTPEQYKKVHEIAHSAYLQRIGE